MGKISNYFQFARKYKKNVRKKSKGELPPNIYMSLKN